MKKKWNVFVSIFFALSLIYSCQSEDDLGSLNNDLKSSPFVKNYDFRMQLLAKSLSKSLNDIELRQLVKEKALEEWDGDTEFLFKDIKDLALKNNISVIDKFAEKIENTNTKVLKSEIATYNNDNAYRKKLEKMDEKSIKREYINQFSKDFPSLQIAVRGPVDEWDIENVHPLVVYVPSSFSEDWKTIDAINDKGESVTLNLMEDFKQPIIVLSKCERTDFEGELKGQYKKRDLNSKSASVVSSIPPPNCLPINPPSNLVATVHPNGIYLSWDYSGSHPLEWVRFRIYRDGAGVTNKFIKEVNGNEPFSIFDVQELGASQMYRYIAYAYAISQNGTAQTNYSTWSNWVTTPENGSVMQSFSATNEGNINTLDWERPIVTNYSGVIVEYKPQNSGWVELLKTYESNTIQYTHTHNESRTGTNMQYSIRTYNAYGQSDAIYDVVKISERKSMEDLYITAIKLDDVRAVESQIYGKPEFEISVSQYDPSDNSTTDGDNKLLNYVKKDIVLSAPSQWVWIPPNLFQNGLFVGKYDFHIMNWDNTFHKSVLNIHVAEHDDETVGTIYEASLALMKAVKNNLDSTTHKLINTGADAFIDVTQVLVDEWNMHRGDREIGSEKYAYWYPVNYTLDLSFGCKIRLSNVPHPGGGIWLDEWDTN